MKLHKRIIPYTTVFITDNRSQGDIIREADKWINSDSFNSRGQVYIINMSDGMVLRKSRQIEGAEALAPINTNSFIKTALYFYNLKPSVIIDIIGSYRTSLAALFSSAGISFGPLNSAALFLYDYHFIRKKTITLHEIMPILFNNETMKRFAYSQTKQVPDFDLAAAFEKSNEKLPHEAMIDLGQVPANEKNYLLWVPNIRNKKNIWNHFVRITFIAESHNLSIKTFFKSEKDFSVFSSVFFILGRKRCMDNNQELIIGAEDIENFFGKLMDEASLIVFSTPRDKYVKLAKEGGFKDKTKSLRFYKDYE